MELNHRRVRLQRSALPLSYLGICWSGQPVTIRRLRVGDALLYRLSYSRMVGSGGN